MYVSSLCLVRRSGIPSAQTSLTVSAAALVASCDLGNVALVARDCGKPTRFMIVPEKLLFVCAGSGTRDQARSRVVKRGAAKQGVHDFVFGASQIGKNESGTS